MENKLHIAMFPWLAMGHITPFVHLANELAVRGHGVSILIPARAQAKLRNLLSLHPSLVTVQTLSVPPVPGLPAGAETTNDILHSSGRLLITAFDLTRHQVAGFLRSTKPDAVFFDLAHWVPALAREVGALSVHYCIAAASFLAYAAVPTRQVSRDRVLTVEELAAPPPEYPSTTLVLRGAEGESLRFLSMSFGEDGVTFHERLTTALRSSDAFGMRTCREIEGELIDFFGEQFEKPVLLSGPILPEAGGGGLEGLDPELGEWLDSLEVGSVVFCAFGSQQVLEKAQYQELLLGFEECGYNFLVALKPPVGCETVEEAFPEGFKERVRDRGVVCGGWVQQPLILSHSAVGCFVSHCGFGSMWESLMSECQLVLVPYLGDQIFNMKLLVEELKVGIEVERDQNRRFSKEGLNKAIRSAMDKDSEVGILTKRNHAKWRQVFTKPGFMTAYVDDFVLKLIDFVVKHHNKDYLN